MYPVVVKNGGFLWGKSSINGALSIAMVDYHRVGIVTPDFVL